MKLGLLRRLSGRCKIKGVVERTREILAEGQSRVFIGTFFRDEAEAIYEAFGPDKAVKIVGGMNDATKAEAQRRFTTDSPDCVSVCVGNIACASVGLTLHGEGRCTTVLTASLPWTPSDLAQLESRLIRLGLPDGTVVQSIIAICALPSGTPSIDEQVFSLLTAKAESTSLIHDGLESQGLVSEQSISAALLDFYSN